MMTPSENPVRTVASGTANQDGRSGQGTLSDRVQSLRLPERGGSKGSWLPWVLCAVFLLSTAAFGYRAFVMGREGSDPKTGGGRPVTPTLEENSAGSGDVVLEAKGYIIPAHQIMISPRVGGMVVELNIEEGKRVKKGDVLARIEDIDYRAEYDRALAAFKNAQERLAEAIKTEQQVWERQKDKARADLAAAEAMLHLRVQELDRTDKLFRRGAVTQQDLDVAVANKVSAGAQVVSQKEQLRVLDVTPQRQRTEAIRAEVSQAQADLDKAKWRLDNCIVRAPLDGTVLTKKAEIWNIVNPVAFNVSASLCDLADLSDIEVDLTIQERDIANVVVGQRCNIMPEAFQNNNAFRKKYPNGYEGVVSRLMPIADRAKGAIPVRVKVTNVPREEEGVYLKPDMGVIVSFKKVNTATEGAKPQSGNQ